MARMKAEQVLEAVHYGLLKSGLRIESTLEEVFGDCQLSEILTGSSSMKAVLSSANQFLLADGYKTTITVLDVIESLWGPDGLKAYNEILCCRYDEISDMPFKSPTIRRLWQLINNVASEIEKKSRQHGFQLDTRPWKHRIRYHRTNSTTGITGNVDIAA